MPTHRILYNNTTTIPFLKRPELMAKGESTSADAAKLLQALESRGLLARDEYERLRDGNSLPAGAPEEALAWLVDAGLLTKGQSRRLEPELASLINQQVPGYQMLTRLGQGAMGTVYKARQLSMDRFVAIKILHPKLAANPDYIQRFLREAHLAAKFSSNNVVQAIDVGQAGPLNYFVMEYVEGTTVKEELEKGRIFKEKEAVEIVVQIAQALHHAHSRKLIHRDIKPANIILTKDGIAKLADLGLARMTTDLESAKAEKGLAIGTPYYMAPEQVRSKEDVDSRADLYSLGATFYHMVTGRPPFDHPTVNEVLKAHLTEALVPPDHLNTKLTSGVGEVVELMMAKKRANRYRSPEGLIIDLECILREEPPRIARQKIDTEILKGLTHGDEDDEADDEEAEPMIPIWWAYALGGGLALSLVLNLLLAMK